MIAGAEVLADLQARLTEMWSTACVCDIETAKFFLYVKRALELAVALAVNEFATGSEQRTAAAIDAVIFLKTFDIVNHILF